MKASVKIRDDEQKPPLLRAKIPISILGLPFISGATAGDTTDLSLHLRTAFHGGPSLKLTYNPSPSPSHHPLSLTLKSGVGRWGSPHLSPLLISAHLSLPSLLNNTGTPFFIIQLKPQIGDFTLRKQAASSSPPPSIKENGGGVHHPIPWPPPRRMGVDDILSSGAAVSVITTLPVCSRAAVKLRWGVKVSEGEVSRWRGLPYLMIEKIGVEAIEKGEKKIEVKEKEKEGSYGDVEAMRGMWFWMRKEVEEIQRENSLIKESIEQVKRMVSDGRGGVGARGVDKEARKHMVAPGDAVSRAGCTATTKS